MALKIVHFIGFQICWFASILGAADGDLWRGPICIGIYAALHVLILARRLPEIMRLLVAAVFGLFADMLLVRLGVLDFGREGQVFAPLWMVLLWVNFMTTIPVTMPWLRKRYALGAAIGVLAGPLCYFAGARLGALAIGAETIRSAALIGLEWALATPALIYLTELTGAWDHTGTAAQAPLMTGGSAS